MAKVVTLGEIMLRLSPTVNLRLVQANNFDVVYGGGEANVAVSLANYGHDVYYVSKLPKNDIGQAAINALRSVGVNTCNIVRGGNRVGIYYLETGVAMRASKVIYDRANSSISLAKAEEFNWENIFKDASLFHFTGITPALSKEAAELTKIALIEAKKRNVKVSVDLNYRHTLWSPEEAQAVMVPLMKYVDICIGNEEDAALSLGFKPKNVDISKGKLNTDSYKDIFKEMKENFGFDIIATSLRESYSATYNGWSVLMYDGEDFYHSKHYEINPIVDRVGGGDSFSAGLIHGLLTRSKKEAVEFAAAAGALKHTIKGDFNYMTEAEVDKLVGGDQSGRVVR